MKQPPALKHRSYILYTNKSSGGILLVSLLGLPLDLQREIKAGLLLSLEMSYHLNV